MIFDVIIEIPRGSADKIEYNEESGKFEIDFVFKDGFRFLFNYGFIPNTRAGDGDTLDAIVLTERVFQPGTVMACKPIGIMRMLDRGAQDDKIIAQPKTEPDYVLTEADQRRFREFYAEVARQKEKVIQIIGFEDAAAAIEEIRKVSQKPPV